MYLISLSNGNVIENLELNGNNYIANTILKASVFANGLSEVTITDNYGRKQLLKDVKLVHLTINEEENKTYFVIRPKTKEEKNTESIQRALSLSENSITDIQLALAEIYEFITGGLFK